LNRLGAGDLNCLRSPESVTLPLSRPGPSVLPASNTIPQSCCCGRVREGRRMMRMDARGLWKWRGGGNRGKAKAAFPLSHHPWKSRKAGEISTFPQPRRRSKLQFKTERKDDDDDADRNTYRPDYAEQPYYNARMGRFWSPDRGGVMTANPSNPTTWNRYALDNGDPINLGDLTQARPAGPANGRLSREGGSTTDLPKSFAMAAPRLRSAPSSMLAHRTGRRQTGQRCGETGSSRTFTTSRTEGSARAGTRA
jgi:hypothetical protein